MVLVGFICWGIVICTLPLLLPESALDKRMLIIFVLSSSFLFALLRWVDVNIIKKRVAKKRLAIVGYDKNVELFSEEISKIDYSNLQLSSVYIIGKEERTDLSLPNSGSGSVLIREGLLDFLCKGDFDILALDSTNGHFSTDQMKSILQLKYEGKVVSDLASLYEHLTGKVPLSAIDSQWLLQNPEFRCNGGKWYRSVKRVLDVIMASGFLLAGLPLMVLIAVAVRLESKGAALFVQERLGLHRKPFRCYKFRTMVQDAESESGPVWATGDDPRITRVGRILRQSRLDELPQLWNILKGEMTFVGPRPIREHFADHLTQLIPFYDVRFCVKPGLTGWAQVNYDYAGSDEGQMEKFQYDLFYILNRSLKLDLLAMIKTCKIVIKRAGT